MMNDTAILHAACANGDLAPIQHLTESQRLTPTDIRVHENRALSNACEYGHLAVAQWLTERFNLNISDVITGENRIIYVCASRGRLDVLQWMARRFGLQKANLHRLTTHAFDAACRHGRLPVAQWLASHFALTAADLPSGGLNALSDACIGGNLELVQWLIREFDLPCADVHATLACMYGHVDVAQWLTTTLGVREDTHTALVSVYQKGHLGVLRWLAMRSALHRTTVLDGIMCALRMYEEKNQYAVVTWLSKYSGVAPVYDDASMDLIVYASCRRGDPRVLQWLVDMNPVVKQQLCGQKLRLLKAACDLNHADMAKWLHEYTDHMMTEDSVTSCVIALHSACRHGNLDLAKWLTDTFRVDTDDIRRYHRRNEMLASICTDAHMELLQWYVAQFTPLPADVSEALRYTRVGVPHKPWHITAVCWLVDKYNVPLDQIDTVAPDGTYKAMFTNLCMYGDVESLRWYADHYRFTKKYIERCRIDALRAACTYGHLAVAQWLTVRFRLTRKDASSSHHAVLKGACRAGYGAVARWLVARFRLGHDGCRVKWSKLLDICNVAGHTVIGRWIAGMMAKRTRK